MGPGFRQDDGGTGTPSKQKTAPEGAALNRV